MLADDSVVVRGLVTRWLAEEADLELVAAVSDGALALKRIAELKPDVLLLDVEMPNMDGMTALPKLLAAVPGLKVVMASTPTLQNAEISLKAMELGAADCLAKPSSGRSLEAAQDYRSELVAKVRALGQGRRRRQEGFRPGTAAAPAPRAGGLYGRAPVTLRRPSLLTPKVVAIGCSTGGPQALFEIFRELGSRIRLPILITQHMPAKFTTILAEHLSRIGGVKAAEARDGEPLLAERVYVAPGEFHMIVEGAGMQAKLRLTQTPPENFCRQAVDPMFRSLAKAFGGQVLAAVLTGMGQDGLVGGRAVVEAGGTLIAQDEASSIVWGMPGAVATAGLCAQVLPLGEIARAILAAAAGAVR
ncbi:MAG: chemotaxis response regulator protein-glutamate methylesterase [Alphaproteobacteria bacterium]|nr:chemotaxis response regulator protein-glutamate methylesterase [Alphaproteobacteria bacterium]